VVGTSKIEDTQGYFLDTIRTIFEEQDIQCVPSKYFVCMKDIYPEAWKIAFTEEDRKQGTMLLDTYPIIRSTEAVYNNFHKLETAADLAKQLENDCDTEEED